MKVEFVKMSGAGNDFVVIDNRDGRIQDGSSAARILCDRHNGVGGDGLLLLEPSSKVAYRMMYYNADGSYGGMCGNGGRCIALYASRTGIAPVDHQFEALDHVYLADVSEGMVRLTMKDPRLLNRRMMLPIGKKRIPVFFIDTGSPHVVVAASHLTKKGLGTLDVKKLGQLIRYHEKFSPQGTNVNFVEIGRDKSVVIRTYERGVESETLACGTGSIAAGIFACVVEGLAAPIVVLPRSGERLIVNFRLERNGDIRGVILEGPAKETFRGSVEI